MSADLEDVQGRDWNIRCTVFDQDEQPKNLTGASVEWQLAKRWGQVAVLSKSSPSGIAFPDAAGGVFEVQCARAETAALAPGRYIHEATVTDQAGLKKTVFRGGFLVLPRQVT